MLKKYPETKQVGIVGRDPIVVVDCTGAGEVIVNFPEKYDHYDIEIMGAATTYTSLTPILLYPYTSGTKRTSAIRYFRTNDGTGTANSFSSDAANSAGNIEILGQAYGSSVYGQTDVKIRVRDIHQNYVHPIEWEAVTAGNGTFYRYDGFGGYSSNEPLTGVGITFQNGNWAKGTIALYPVLTTLKE